MSKSIAEEVLALKELTGAELINFRPAVAVIATAASTGGTFKKRAFIVPAGKAFVVTEIEVASFAMGEDGNPVFSTWRPDFYGESWKIIFSYQPELLPASPLLNHYLVAGTTFKVLTEGTVHLYTVGEVAAPATEAFSMYMSLRVSGYLVPASVGNALAQFEQTVLP